MDINNYECAVCGKDVGEMYYTIDGKKVCMKCGGTTISELFNINLVDVTDTSVKVVDVDEFLSDD